MRNAVIRDSRDGIDLDSLIWEELASVYADDPSRARLDGSTVLLHPHAAEPLALVLHELTANTLKQAALSTSSGCIAAMWRLDDQDRVPNLVLDWRDRGLRLDPIAAPRRGFSRVGLEKLLAYQLQAWAELGFSPDRLTCGMVLLLTERILQATGEAEAS